MNNPFALIQARIEEACARAGRQREEVTLVAVSKFHPLEAVLELAQAGQREFGESRAQELEEKATKAQSLSAESGPALEWHFIGQLQKNKVRKVLQFCSWIHSVESLSLAERISRIAGEEGKQAKIFLQVSLAEEERKRGFEAEQLKLEFARLAALPHLQLQGLMCIPPPVSEAEEQRKNFRALRLLRDELAQEFQLPLPSLSMGMSGDFEVAIEEGATHIRLGTILFGERSKT